MIAALYILEDGPYIGRDDVDPWPESRDARSYEGPHPVVAHPPCKRWGRYWSGGPSAKVRREKGADGGCFRAAMGSVIRWGGVLEHPEGSHAWNAFGIAKPPKSGGWVNAGLYTPGWTCCVEQGHYGHPARKATWLYAVGAELPELIWGKAHGKRRLDDGATRAQRAAGVGVNRDRITPRECIETPEPFVELLLSIARSAL